MRISDWSSDVCSSDLVQKEAGLSAKRAIVTVEAVVDGLAAHPNACVLPYWTIDAIAVVPSGARPSYVHGRYGRDNDFYQQWDAIARDRDRFLDWMAVNVLGGFPESGVADCPLDRKSAG